MLNRASTTFKALPDNAKLNLDQTGAIKLMIAQPSMIKRPVFETANFTAAGFKPEAGLLEKLR